MYNLYIYRCVLAARSPVFHAMLSSTNHFKESTEKVIIIPDVEPDVLKEVLLYIYTDECSTDIQTILERMSEPLLLTAVKYQIPGLTLICEDYYIHNITIENVINTLFISDTYQLNKLKEHCLNYIIHHIECILQCKEYHILQPVYLKQEIEQLIELVSRRKGCRGSGYNSSDILHNSNGVMNERRLGSSCVIC